MKRLTWLSVLLLVTVSAAAPLRGQTWWGRDQLQAEERPLTAPELHGLNITASQPQDVAALVERNASRDSSPLSDGSDSNLMYIVAGSVGLVVIIGIVVAVFLGSKGGAEEVPAQQADLNNVDVERLLQVSVDKMADQLQSKLARGSRVREIVEDRAGRFADKAKDFAVNELNNTSRAIMKALDAEEATMLLDFNHAVEASFPPVSVLIAGVTSPAVLSLSLVAHSWQLFSLFLPTFLLTAWSLYEDHGAVCDIPTMQAWIWVAFVVSGTQVFGRGYMAARIAVGQRALRLKTAEIAARMQANADDGEASVSDLQEIFIGSTVLVQEALLLEDRIRQSHAADVVGATTFLWMIAVIWNYVLVIVWTFVPGTTAFHEKAHSVAEGDFCGAWASVFSARLICLLTPFFFFVNVAAALLWVFVKVVHSDSFADEALTMAKTFDTNYGGVPVARTLVKAFLLRASVDAVPARLTVALGEALRLSKERDDLQGQLEAVERRISGARSERRHLKKLAEKTGGDLESNLTLLEQAGQEDATAWKRKGARLALEAERRAAEGAQIATEELDKVIQYCTDLAERVQNSEVVKSAIEKARLAAEDAKVAAEEAAGKAREAAASGMAQAQSGLEAGMAYAQSDEAQAALARARTATSEGLQHAQSGLQAGVAYAQSEEAQAALEKARDKASAGLQQAQSGLQAGLEYAQSEEAQATLQRARGSAEEVSQQAKEAAKTGAASAAKAAKKYHK